MGWTVAVWLLAWSAGVYCGRLDVHTDAAKLGLGAYCVDKASGRPVFKWNMSLLPAE